MECAGAVSMEVVVVGIDKSGFRSPCHLYHAFHGMKAELQRCGFDAEQQVFGFVRRLGDGFQSGSRDRRIGHEVVAILRSCSGGLLAHKQMKLKGKRSVLQFFQDDGSRCVIGVREETGYCRFHGNYV